MSDLQNTGLETGATQAREARRGAKAKMQQAGETLRSNARRYADAAQRQAGVAQQRAIETIREQPGTTMAAALGVGLLVGVLVGYGLAVTVSGWNNSER